MRKLVLFALALFMMTGANAMYDDTDINVPTYSVDASFTRPPIIPNIWPIAPIDDEADFIEDADDTIIEEDEEYEKKSKKTTVATYTCVIATVVIVAIYKTIKTA